jgi:hypothetical protein
MGRIALPNVAQKGGRTYYRKKVGGKDFYLRLPDIDDPRFAEAYEKAKGVPTRESARPGTMAALVAEYKQSAEFLSIRSDATRRNYLRYRRAWQAARGADERP